MKHIKPIPTTLEGWLENPPPACQCDKCKGYCHRPCWGTPAQVEKIMDAGYSDWLMLDYWVGSDYPIYVLAGALPGRQKRVAPADPRSKSYCAFFVNGLCQLHDAGLKPLEGVLAHHDDDQSDPQILHEWLSKQWDEPAGRALVERWRTEHDMWDDADMDSGDTGLFGMYSSFFGD